MRTTTTVVLVLSACVVLWNRFIPALLSPIGVTIECLDLPTNSRVLFLAQRTSMYTSTSLIPFGLAVLRCSVGYIPLEIPVSLRATNLIYLNHFYSHTKTGISRKVY